MGTCFSIAIMIGVTWAVCRITRPWSYQWLVGLALIVSFFFIPFSSWLETEECKKGDELDAEILLQGILFMGLAVIGDWWNKDEPQE